MNSCSTVVSSPVRTVPVRLFGAFRQFGDVPAVAIPLPVDARVADLRAGLAAHYAENENALSLLRASVFATDEAVLDDDEPVPEDQHLSILPPVCGG